MSDNFQITSYVSPNVSPEVLLACGPVDDVKGYAILIGHNPGVTIEAQADDGRTGFLKAHIGNMTYKAFMNLMQLRPINVDVPFVRRAIPSSEHGRVHDVGNPHAEPVIVGILCDASTALTIKEHLDWAFTRPLSLGFTGEGIYFEPGEEALDAYSDFVRDAEAGLYANAVVVLLRRV